MKLCFDGLVQEGDGGGAVMNLALGAVELGGIAGWGSMAASGSRIGNQSKAALTATHDVQLSAPKWEMADLTSLTPTHAITKPRSQMQELVNDIRANGIIEPIEFVRYSGNNYIVGGNHRYFTAQKLGIQIVPVREVQLPIAGYKTPLDFIFEGKMPGYWKYIKK